jgi:hypothetical protein
MSLVLEGKDYGDFYGTDFIRNAKGQVVVDADGLPKLMTGGANTYLGNFQPKWNGGVYNRLSYKGLNLGFLIDVRYGGNFYSGTLATMYYYGTAAGTLAGRDGMVVNGVNEDGTPNTKQVTAEAYWKRVAGLNGQGINSAFVFDATSVRFRELSLNYALPKKFLGNSLIKGLTAGIVARNLWVLKSNVNGVDPESSFAASASGFEYVGMPSTRSFGFSLNANF